MIIMRVELFEKSPNHEGKFFLIENVDSVYCRSNGDHIIYNVDTSIFHVWSNSTGECRRYPVNDKELEGYDLLGTKVTFAICIIRG